MSRRRSDKHTDMSDTHIKIDPGNLPESFFGENFTEVENGEIVAAMKAHIGRHQNPAKMMGSMASHIIASVLGIFQEESDHTVKAVLLTAFGCLFYEAAKSLNPSVAQEIFDSVAAADSNGGFKEAMEDNLNKTTVADGDKAMEVLKKMIRNAE